MLSITVITREYRMFDRDIDTWIKEGWFPAYEWHNGRRYWDSDKFNTFAAGNQISLPKANSQGDSLPSDKLFPFIIFSFFFLLVQLF